MLNSEICENAIEEIERVGWCQNDFITVEGKICLVEALLRVSYRLSQSPIPANLYFDLCNLAGGDAGGVKLLASDFNDAPGRTKEDVIDLLMKGAKFYRDKGQ